MAGILKRLEAWAADSPERHQFLVLVLVLGLGAVVVLFIGMVAWLVLDFGAVAELVE